MSYNYLMTLPQSLFAEAALSLCRIGWLYYIMWVINVKCHITRAGG